MIEKILDEAHKNVAKAAYFLVEMLIKRKMNKEKVKHTIKLLNLAIEELESLINPTEK